MQLPDPSMLEALLQGRQASGWGGLFYGVHPALVKDIADPDNQGRVKVSLPWLPDSAGAACELWARLATFMAGNNRGSWFIPDVDDEVLVAFEAGDLRRPYVIGALWNGQDAPPESMDGGGQNNLKVLRSRNGVKFTMDDQSGQEQLILETPGGQKLTLKDGPGAVEIEDSNGNSIKLESAGITITASAKVTVNASQVAVSASLVTVDAGMSKFSGVVKADTVICNSIISASYTAGRGEHLVKAVAQRLADHPLAWTAPPPFWQPGANTAAARDALARPQILRFASDDFMDELLATLDSDPAALASYAAVAETWRGAGVGPPANPARWLDRSPARLLGVQRKALLRSKAAAVGMASTAAAPGSAAATAVATAAQAAAVQAAQVAQAALPLKLYQPAHQRHYLVAGALVCQTAGLPDRAIDPARHKVSFVLRRLFPKTPMPPPQKLPAPTDLALWDEYAYVLQGKAGQWQRVGAAELEGELARRMPGEERQPLFPARYTQDDGRGRRLFVGSVPVGKRETFQAAQASAPGNSAPPPMDPRVALFHKQVLGPWKAMVAGAMRNGVTGTPADMLQALRDARLPVVCAAKGDDDVDVLKPDPSGLREARSRLQTASWYLLLELLHFLQQHTPDFWASHLLPSVRPDPGPWRTLYDALNQAAMPADLAGPGWTLNTPNTDTGGLTPVSLYDLHAGYRGRSDLNLLAALQRAAGVAGLEATLDAAQDTLDLPATGTAAGWPDFLFLFADPWFGVLTPPAPAGFAVQTSDYLSERIVALIDSLADTLAAAVADGPAADPTLPDAPLASVLPADMREAWYLMRLVYERPDCAPFHGSVVSQATAPFQMAGFFDPDAPARPIRIGLPLDISPAGLRKFDKNTVFVMSDMLCGHIDRMKGLSFGDLVLSVLPFPFHKGLSVPEKGPCKQGTDPLGVMCSLSIPIITICALILLMIIVSLLDLIFRWLPYFVVCFPLPGFKGKKES